MINQLSDLFPYILAAALIAVFSSPMLLKACIGIGLLDQPGSAPHKIHTSPVPLAGGLILGLSMFVVFLVSKLAYQSGLLVILIGSELIMVWGLVDDFRSVRPLIKLSGQVLLSVWVLSQGIAIQITGNDWLNYVLTILWVVGLTNAFNFVDSMDGLAVGLGGIAAAFFMLVTIDSRQPYLAVFSAILLGVCIGTYYLGAAPARLFLGDSGSQMLGFALACVGITYTPAQAGLPQSLTWFIPILVLGVPIFDMVLVVVTRLLRHMPVYRPGTDHTYHRLLIIGLDSTRAVLSMQFAAIFLGLLAFILLQVEPITANIVFGIVVLSGIVLLGVLNRIGLEKSK
jgi:UDP-GlcNAc:undecaprenyl-phosphate GlcNAc-1-phosphate transferase